MLRKALILLILAGTISAIARANPIIPIPTQPQPVISPSSPNINASGYILLDANSGKVLAEKNADARMAPASLTKLMTMYVISNALKSGNIHLDDKVRISEKAWRTGGSRMFVKVNDEVPVRDLLQGIVVASGNDASVAMAEYLAGTEEAFAGLMNTEGQLIGMKGSHFMDSNGLPNPNHYSTPRDLALLAAAIIRNFPEDYQLYSEKWFSYNHIRQPNRNRLLWRFPYADGLKTGHTEAAGYCLVGSASKNGTRLISVIMGAPSDSVRTEDSIRLLTYGFRFYETHKLYNGGSALIKVRVWKGQEKQVALGVSKDFYVTIPAGQYKNIQANLELNDPIKAPVLKGQAYGTIKVTLNNQILASEPLIALNNNMKGGIWRSMSDSLSFSFNKLFSHSNEKANNG
ncbi:MAG TPA: D-alanyl-D-alanine carboxypeptidase family protein [Gammaproteobacteria bacterium]|nr:D-alanyl-D-alanine carboxypeptidase family protein [Gammaproteobacteria bacterium]